MSLEEKQFKIDRIDRTINNIIEDWRILHESYINLVEEIEKASKRERNPMLTVCGIIVTILLGLASIKTIDVNTLEFYLFIDTGIAITIFTFYGIYGYYLTSKASKPESAMNVSITNMSAHRLAFSGGVYDIKTLETERINYYYLMTYLIDGSNKIRVKNEIFEFAKMKIMAKLVRNDLIRVASGWDVGITNAVKIYELSEEEFNKEFWVNYQTFIQEVKQLAKQPKT